MKILAEPKHVPFGPYLSQMHVDDDFCTRLLEVGRTLTKKHTQYLAGNIDEEYVFDLKKDSWIEEEFKVAINTWIAGFRQFSGDRKFQPSYKLHPLWINFQKAGEYNPIHLHPGCNLSFVLFLEIPEEMLKEKSKISGIPPGYLGFMYGENIVLHGSVTHRVIQPKVGTLVMFPSILRHYVSHFTSNVIRTSVSGNISFGEVI